MLSIPSIFQTNPIRLLKNLSIRKTWHHFIIVNTKMNGKMPISWKSKIWRTKIIYLKCRHSKTCLCFSFLNCWRLHDDLNWTGKKVAIYLNNCWSVETTYDYVIKEYSLVIRRIACFIYSNEHGIWFLRHIYQF